MLRLLILHVNLAKLCTGKALGDTASTEEHNLQILYYHHDTPDPGSDSEDPRREAVPFALLCTALYNLPSTINEIKNPEASYKDKFDPTREVRLDGCTLVFVPLEEDVDDENRPLIICVAQITSSENSLAIQQSIQRSHTLFCLLRSGGIHVRLSKSKKKNVTTNGEGKSRDQWCPYPGMDQYFEGLKTMRSLKEAIARSSDEDLESERHELVEKLQRFEESLPIVALREDLKVHYDAWIADFGMVSDRTGAAGRCLVESIPPPITSEERAQWSPRILPTYVSFPLGHTINKLLSEWRSLVAVSTFYDKQLVFHHDKDETCLQDKSTVTLLMGYFAFYDFKMKQHHACPELGQGLVSFSDSMQVDPCGEHNDNCGSDERGGFLPPPPLAMLSASDCLSMVRGPDGKPVWAPAVYFKGLRPNSTEDGQQCDLALSIVYSCFDFSFLFFIDPGLIWVLDPAIEDSTPPQEDKDRTDELLAKVSIALMGTLALHAGYGMSSPQRSMKVSNDSPNLRAEGRDIIFVDRANSEMKLFSRCISKSKQENASNAKRFFRSFRQVVPAAPESSSAVDNGAVAWASEGLDCRHWLASHLPADALSAIDDAMNNAYYWRCAEVERVRPGCSGDDGCYEILTTLSHGWVYAFANGKKEIYILLDSSVFVTLADAHNSINEVRCALLPASCTKLL